MRLGLLTGGGDCPGLNAAIRAVVRQAHDEHGATVFGFRDGWRGVMEGTADELTRDEVRGILPRGGTILGTSGVQPFRTTRRHRPRSRGDRRAPARRLHRDRR